MQQGSAQAVQATKRQLALALSAAVVLLAAPLAMTDHCDSVLARQAWTCVMSIVAFKVAALGLGRGVLARELQGGSSWGRLVACTVLPVVPLNLPSKPIPKEKRQSLSTAKLVTSMLKLLGFAGVTLAGMWVLYGTHAAHGSPLMRAAQPLLFYISGLALWLEVDGMGDIVDALAIGMCGVEPEPHFRNPCMSESLGEYWSRRWNITVSSVLRDLVYEPVCEGRLFAAPRTNAPSRPPSAIRRFFASTATFGFSGLWHELVFRYITGGAGTRGYWPAFFLIQAPLVAAEAALRYAARRRGRTIPRWAAIVAVNLCVVACINALWAPPMLWPLPSTCPGDATPASVLQAIMAQGHRDIQHSLRGITAAGSALMGAVVLPHGGDGAARLRDALGGASLLQRWGATAAAA